MPDTRDQTPEAEIQPSTIPEEQSSAIVEVPEIEHTAESLGIELPESREECERLLVRELGDARLEAGELLDNLQRVAAEFDNYRKRTERDRVENVQRASQRVIESLLPALDSLDAAIALDATTDTGAKMLEGMKSTHAQILYALKGDVVQRGMRSLLGVDFPVFEKRRFQHGAVDAAVFRDRVAMPPDRYRTHFSSLHGAAPA